MTRKRTKKRTTKSRSVLARCAFLEREWRKLTLLLAQPLSNQTVHSGGPSRASSLPEAPSSMKKRRVVDSDSEGDDDLEPDSEEERKPETSQLRPLKRARGSRSSHVSVVSYIDEKWIPRMFGLTMHPLSSLGADFRADGSPDPHLNEGQCSHLSAITHSSTYLTKLVTVCSSCLSSALPP